MACFVCIGMICTTGYGATDLADESNSTIELPSVSDATSVASISDVLEISLDVYTPIGVVYIYNDLATIDLHSNKAHREVDCSCDVNCYKQNISQTLYNEVAFDQMDFAKYLHDSISIVEKTNKAEKPIYQPSIDLNNQPCLLGYQLRALEQSQHYEPPTEQLNL